jgi:hypothetical protein
MLPSRSVSVQSNLELVSSPHPQQQTPRGNVCQTVQEYFPSILSLPGCWEILEIFSLNILNLASILMNWNFHTEYTKTIHELDLILCSFCQEYEFVMDCNGLTYEHYNVYRHYSVSFHIFLICMTLSGKVYKSCLFCFH